MTTIALSVRSVSKRYRMFSSPQERVKEALHPFRKTYHREFWALRDVTFDVRRGETVGILGRNGSGKSTLLQLVCSVSTPTAGSIKVNGRIAALLELGAGFNPQFTGRENVILSGTIMGVPRQEMLKRLPAIEAFADVGEFFDQPVKTYSSGMFVRVAFAVAINVDPDILVIDEALAVGDAKFQHKCFQKFTEFKQAGKTIIVVSHALELITAHCDHAILIDAGRLVAEGSPKEVVDRYIKLIFGPALPEAELHGTGAQASCLEVSDVQCQDEGHPEYGAGTPRAENRVTYNKDEIRLSNGAAEILDYTIEVAGSKDTPVIPPGAVVNISTKVRFNRSVEQPMFGFCVKTLNGLTLYGSNTFMQRLPLPAISEGAVRTFTCSFVNRLSAGDYFLDVGVAEWDGTAAGKPLDIRRSIAHFTVVPHEASAFDGLIDLRPEWSIKTT